MNFLYFHISVCTVEGTYLSGAWGNYAKTLEVGGKAKLSFGIKSYHNNSRHSEDKVNF